MNNFEEHAKGFYSKLQDYFGDKFNGKIAAKRLNNNRNYETNCLLEKLDMLEDDSHEVESQKVYCKIR